jgi:hypothetical protein
MIRKGTSKRRHIVKIKMREPGILGFDYLYRFFHDRNFFLFGQTIGFREGLKVQQAQILIVAIYSFFYNNFKN